MAGSDGNCHAAAGKEYMGRKDMTGRAFFSDKERFAELLNLHLYHGAKVLLPENLIQRKREYPSLADVYGQKNRDILMEDRKHRICYGVELETGTDYSMPERIMVYDACEYEHQIRALFRKHREEGTFDDFWDRKSRIKKDDLLLPTVTVVLYLGEGHWEGKRRLTDLFHIPVCAADLPESKICDYAFSLLEADFLSAEDHRTDLKEFFQAMQCRQDRERLKQLIRSDGFQRLSPETELVIAAHLNIRRLVRRMRKGEVPMCKAFDDLMQEERRNGRKEGMERGIEKGLERGIKKGKKEGKKAERLGIIGRMKKEGLEEALIIRLTGCTKEEYATAPGI